MTQETDKKMLVKINPSECTDCGLCREVCPAEAVFVADSHRVQFVVKTNICGDKSPYSCGEDFDHAPCVVWCPINSLGGRALIQT